MNAKILSSPYSVYLNLTEKCNLRCLHCFGDYGDKKEELSLNEWKEVIDELILNNVFYVNISGGEPTQSSHFEEVIKYLKKKGLHFILTTNGIFSNKYRKIILNAKDYLIGIKISLDGFDSDSHCFIRRDKNGKANPKLFEITMKNIRYFKKKGINLTIATILHTKIIKDIDSMFNLIKKINPISWFISPIAPLGRANKNKKINESYETYDLNFWNMLEKKANENKINIHFVDLPVQKGNKLKLSCYECSGAVNFCEIHCDGQVSPCSLARVGIDKKYIQFDNIKNREFEMIWNGEPFNKFRSCMDKGCNGCKLKSKCNKCIAQSFRYFDNGESPTPFCIKQGKKLGLIDYENYRKVLVKHGVKCIS